jgi:ABC-2 type transport system permease protein
MVADGWRAYPPLLRAAIQVAMTYRGRVLFAFIGALFPMLMLFVWLTVAASGPPATGWDAGRFVSYYLAAAVVNELATSSLVWTWDGDLRSGEFSTKLLRPVSVFHQYAAAEVGGRVLTSIVMVVALVVITIAVPMVNFPANAIAVAMAVVAVALAVVLALLMSSTFALIGFWTTQSANVYMLFWGIGAFASGWIAPRELMPWWLQRISEVLPFRYTLGFPVEIALGISTRGTTAGFAVALGWVMAFAFAYRTLWRYGIRRYQAVGG